MEKGNHKFLSNILRSKILRRVFLMFINVAIGTIVLGSALLFLFQERIIYVPRGYGIRMEQIRPRDATVLRYQTACGRQVAFYVRPQGGAEVPRTVWVAFNGNASLALDMLDLYEEAPDPAAAFLLVDYPSYGECEGKPSPQSILESSEGALAALAEHLKTAPKQLYAHLNVFGYSIGAAAALQLAARHEVEKVVLVSPFTTMMEMARRQVGWPLCLMLRHRFDNRSRMLELAKQAKRPKVVMFHGVADPLIPIAMSRELASLVPGWVEFHEVPGADHVSVIDGARAGILKALGK